MNNKNDILKMFPPAEKYEEYTVSEISPDERVSATSTGTSWAPPSLLSSMDDETLWIEICLDKMLRGSNVWVLPYLVFDSLSDTTVVGSTEEPSNFVKSKPEAWSSWYEPSAKIFA